MHLSAQLKENRPARRKVRHIGLTLGVLAAGTLVIFHALLFAERLRDLTILQPGVALQWIGTLFLLTFLAYLKRRHVSLLRGRSALAFWLLVLLLHLTPAVPSSPVAVEHADLLLALPTSWMSAGTLWLALALTALLVGVSLSSGLQAPRPRHSRRGAPALAAGFRSRLFARPPPLARLH